MKDVVTSILTDKDARDNTAVEDVLMQQAAAIPWADA
jgi:hypothetical protein